MAKNNSKENSDSYMVRSEHEQISISDRELEKLREKEKLEYNTHDLYDKILHKQKLSVEELEKFKDLYQDLKNIQVDVFDLTENMSLRLRESLESLRKIQGATSTIGLTMKGLISVSDKLRDYSLDGHLITSSEVKSIEKRLRISKEEIQARGLLNDLSKESIESQRFEIESKLESKKLTEDQTKAYQKQLAELETLEGFFDSTKKLEIQVGATDDAKAAVGGKRKDAIFKAKTNTLSKIGLGDIAEDLQSQRERAKVAAKKASEAVRLDGGSDKDAKKAAKKAAKAEMLGLSLEQTFAIFTAFFIKSLKTMGNLLFQGIKKVLNLLKSTLNYVSGQIKAIFSKTFNYLREVWNYMFQVNQAATDLTRIIGSISTGIASGIVAEGQDAVEVMNNIREIAESTQMDPITFLGKGETQNIVNLKKQLGLSAQEAGNLATRAKLADTNSLGYLKTVEKAYNTSQKQSILEKGKYLITATLNQLNKKVLGTSDEMAISFGLSKDRLAGAVLQAAKLGLEIEDIKGIANSMLDFESSIGAEMEAQLLTGRQMNLNQARLYALQGDYVKLGQELERQNISAQDYAGMNLVQRNAVAKALGMSNEQMAKMLIQQSKSNALIGKGKELTKEQQANLMGMTVEQFEAVSAQDRWNAMMAGFKAQLIPIVQKHMPDIVKLIKSAMSLLPGLSNIISTVADRLLPKFTDFWDTNLFPAINRLLNILNGILGPTLDWLVGVVEDFAKAFNSSFEGTTILSDLKKNLGDTFKALNLDLNSARNGVISIGGAIGTWIANKLKQVNEFLKNPEEAAEKIKVKIDSIKEKIVSVWNTLKKVFNLVKKIAEHPVRNLLLAAAAWSAIKTAMVGLMLGSAGGGFLGRLGGAGKSVAGPAAASTVGKRPNRGTGVGPRKSLFRTLADKKAATKGANVVRGAKTAVPVNNTAVTNTVKGTGSVVGGVGGMLGKAGAFVLIAGGIWILSKALASLANIDFGRLMGSVLGLTVLSGVVAAIVTVLGGLGPVALAGALAFDLIAGGIWIIAKALQTAEPVITKVLEALKPIFEGIGNFFTNFPETVRAFGEVLEKVFTSAFNGIIGTVEALGNGIRNVLSGIGDAISSVFEGIIGTVEALGNTIKGIVADIFDGIVNTIKAGGDAIKSAGEGIGAAAQGIGNGLRTAIKGDEVGKIEAVGNILQNIDEKALDRISVVIDKLASSFTKLVEPVNKLKTRNLEAIFSANTNFGTNLISYVSSIGEKLGIPEAASWKTGFATGGIVGGNSYTGDKLNVGVNSGEMILNTDQQANLFRLINLGNTNSLLLFSTFNGILNGVHSGLLNLFNDVTRHFSGIVDILQRMLTTLYNIVVPEITFMFPNYESILNELKTIANNILQSISSIELNPTINVDSNISGVCKAFTDNILATVQSIPDILAGSVRSILSEIKQPEPLIINETNEISVDDKLIGQIAVHAANVESYSKKVDVKLNEFEEKFDKVIDLVSRGFREQVAATRDSKLVMDWDWVKFDRAYAVNVPNQAL